MVAMLGGSRGGSGKRSIIENNRMKENTISWFVTLSGTVYIHTVIILFKTIQDWSEHTFVSFNLAANFNVYSPSYSWGHSINIYWIKINFYMKFCVLWYTCEK